MIGCEHWSECDIVGGGCCTIGAYDRPSYGICLNICEKYQGDPVERERLAAQLAASIQAPPIESRGWGTLINTAIDAVLNWIDRLPRRPCYGLGFIQRIKACGGSGGQ